MARPRRRFVVLAAIALASLVLAGSGVAQQLTPRLALERLFTSDEPSAAWFAPAFLDQIPVEQVANAVDRSRDGLGAFASVEPDGDRYRVVFEDGFVPVIVQLDGQGRIQGLRLLPAVRPAADVAGAVDGFAELPGSVAVLVTRDGSDLASLASTERLAVGSTFKLAVLAALLDRIEAGDLAWDDVVTLDPAWRSLPSGLLQDWPDGSALTLETLATLMISRSDNTATDALIDIVGREAVEAVEGVGAANRPFLRTREAFVLKATGELRERYLAADEAGRREVLDEVADAPLPPADELASSAATAQDIEWFFSAETLCELMTRVAHLPLMSVTPGVADPSHWASVAFKGGSEPGVVNLTTRLEAGDGTSYCVSATWNQASAVDEDRFQSLYAGLLEVVRGR